MNEFVPQTRLRVYIVCMRRDIHDGRTSRKETVREHCKYIPVASGCLGALVPEPDSDGVTNSFLAREAAGGETVIDWPAPGQISKRNGHSCKIREVLDPPSAATDAIALSEHQWAKVVEHEGGLEATCARRLVQLDGQAQCLRSQYRRDWKYISQFVPRESGLPRFFTHRECLRIMGFPDSFKHRPTDSFYQQIGNAVVPPIVQEIGSRILDAMGV